MVNPFLSWKDTKDILSVLHHMYAQICLCVWNKQYLQHEIDWEADYVSKNLTEKIIIELIEYIIILILRNTFLYVFF